MSMERREAWRDSLPLRAAFDRLIEDAVVRVDRVLGTGTREVAIDLREDNDRFTVTASLPGVRPEDINLIVENQTLTVEGEWQREETEEWGQWHLRERAQGRFMRTVRLPAPVDGERVQAHLENGVLVVELPKAPAAQRRRIAIGAQRGASGGSSVTVGQRGDTVASGTAGSTARESATGANAGPGGQAIAAGQPAASSQLEPGKQPADDDPVTRDSIDSFPASDPPSYTPERI